MNFKLFFLLNWKEKNALGSGIIWLSIKIILHQTFFVFEFFSSLVTLSDNQQTFKFN